MCECADGAVLQIDRRQEEIEIETFTSKCQTFFNARIGYDVCFCRFSSDTYLSLHDNETVRRKKCFADLSFSAEKHRTDLCLVSAA